jgi:hypothetical protein
MDTERLRALVLRLSDEEREALDHLFAARPRAPTAHMVTALVFGVAAGFVLGLIFSSLTGVP